MTKRGVFAVHRGWFDHPSFAREKFTEREAWAWLISEAAWKPRTRRVEKFVVDLERGQLVASVRHLARVWQWTPGKAERFLNRLKNETMIETDARQGISVITICNYNKYQRVSLPNETQNETPNETRPRQQRDNTEDIKTLNTAAASSDQPPMSNLPDYYTPSDLVLDAMKVHPDERLMWGSQRPRLQVWMSKWDLDLDILPTVRRLMAAREAKAQGPPRTLAFFESAIADAHATRTAPLPAGKPEKRNVIGENRSLSSFARAAACEADEIARGHRFRDEGSGSSIRVIPGGKSA